MAEQLKAWGGEEIEVQILLFLSLSLSLFLFWLCWVFTVAQGLSCLAACGILVPRPRIEPTSLHCKADSEPLEHQGSPPLWFLQTYVLCPS